MRLGIVLQPAELLYAMGFPVSAYEADLVHFDDCSLRRMVSNAILSGAAGPMLLPLLNLLKEPASDTTVEE